MSEPNCKACTYSSCSKGCDVHFNELSASQAREAVLHKKLEERTEEMLRIAGLNATNVGLLKAAEARISKWQQGENEDLTAARRENAELRKLLEGSKVPESLRKVSSERLGGVFEKVLADNLWELYESAQPKEPKQ